MFKLNSAFNHVASQIFKISANMFQNTLLILAINNTCKGPYNEHFCKVWFNSSCGITED